MNVVNETRTQGRREVEIAEWGEVGWHQRGWHRISKKFREKGCASIFNAKIKK